MSNELNPTITAATTRLTSERGPVIKQVGVSPQQLKAAASVMAHFHARPRPTLASGAAAGSASRPAAASLRDSA